MMGDLLLQPSNVEGFIQDSNE